MAKMLEMCDECTLFKKIFTIFCFCVRIKDSVSLL